MKGSFSTLLGPLMAIVVGTGLPNDPQQERLKAVKFLCVFAQKQPNLCKKIAGFPERFIEVERSWLSSCGG